MSGTWLDPEKTRRRAGEVGSELTNGGQTGRDSSARTDKNDVAQNLVPGGKRGHVTRTGVLFDFSAIPSELDDIDTLLDRNDHRGTWAKTRVTPWQPREFRVVKRFTRY